MDDVHSNLPFDHAMVPLETRSTRGCGHASFSGGYDLPTERQHLEREHQPGHARNQQYSVRGVQFSRTTPSLDALVGEWHRVDDGSLILVRADGTVYDPAGRAVGVKQSPVSRLPRLRRFVGRAWATCTS